MDAAETDDAGRHEAGEERRDLRCQVAYLRQVHDLEQPCAEDDGRRQEEAEPRRGLPPRSQGTSTRWPELLTGRNSVAP